MGEESEQPLVEQGDEPQPPKYGTLVDELKHARESSKSVHELCHKAGKSFYYSTGCLPMTFVASLIAISMIVVGAVYFEQCPVEPLIPIWMIVAGSVALAMKNAVYFHRLAYNCKKPDDDEDTKWTWYKGYQTILSIFLIIWFICGSVWVYVNYPPSYDPTSSEYCQPGLYYYAFAIITTAWICLFLSMCFCMCSCIAATPNKKPADPEAQ